MIGPFLAGQPIFLVMMANQFWLSFFLLYNYQIPQHSVQGFLEKVKTLSELDQALANYFKNKLMLEKSGLSNQELGSIFRPSTFSAYVFSGFGGVASTSNYSGYSSRTIWVIFFKWRSHFYVLPLKLFFFFFRSPNLLRRFWIFRSHVFITEWICTKLGMEVPCDYTLRKRLYDFPIKLILFKL